MYDTDYCITRGAGGYHRVALLPPSDLLIIQMSVFWRSNGVDVHVVASPPIGQCFLGRTSYNAKERRCHASSAWRYETATGANLSSSTRRSRRWKRCVHQGRVSSAPLLRAGSWDSEHRTCPSTVGARRLAYSPPRQCSSRRASAR